MVKGSKNLTCSEAFGPDCERIIDIPELGLVAVLVSKALFICRLAVDELQLNTLSTFRLPYITLNDQLIQLDLLPSSLRQGIFAGDSIKFLMGFSRTDANSTIVVRFDILMDDLLTPDFSSCKADLIIKDYKNYNVLHSISSSGKTYFRLKKLE